MKDLYNLLKKSKPAFDEHPDEFRKEEHLIKEIESPEALSELNDSAYLKAKLEELHNDPITQERIIGKNNLMDIHYFRRGLEVAKTVCRVIYWPDHRGEKRTVGTGFLVGPNLLMTNNHVIPNVYEVRHLFAEFEYEKNDGLQVNAQTRLFKLAPDYFFITQPELDYAVIGIEPVSCNQPKQTLENYAWNTLAPAKDKLFKGQFLTIIQHPKGLHKMIAFRENRLITIRERFLHYTTDTDRGSSGSLVANDDWDIVALHRMAVPDLDKHGNMRLSKGGIWQSDQDDNFIIWLANEGVLMDSILEDIARQKVSSPAQREIKDFLLKKA